MKKVIVILIILILTLVSVFGVCFSVKYYRQTNTLTQKVTNLESIIASKNAEVENLKETNQILKSSLTIEQSIHYKTQECMKKSKLYNSWHEQLRI